MIDKIDEFNIDLNESQLSPFVQTYFQTINVFWKDVVDAALYRVRFYILDGTQARHINQDNYSPSGYSIKHFDSSIDDLFDDNNRLKVSIPEVEGKYQSRKYRCMVIIKSIGIRHFYLLNEQLLNRGTCISQHTNLTPNRYCVVILAENQRGEIIAQSRGIEVLLLGTTILRHLDTSMIVYDTNRFEPKNWKRSDYYEEL